MKTARDIILKPIITEESVSGLASKKYTFAVAVDATKIDVKNACEEIFGVTVKKVCIMNCKGKLKRMGRNEGYRPDWKKAIVTVTEDSKTIEFFDNLA